MPRRAMARGGVLLAFVACGAIATTRCKDDETPVCIAAPGATGTCADACARMYEIECLVGKDVEECASLCELAVAPLTAEVRGRVLACYAASSSCESVDHCSLACGEGDTIVRFGSTDGGVLPDAGPVDEDTGPPIDDDMGSPIDDDMGPPVEDDMGPPEDDMGPPVEPDAGGSAGGG